jgi:ankyrin repeat protein
MASPKPEWDGILSAAQKNDVATIKGLVDQGASPNHSNFVGQSALHIACLWGNKEAARLLVSFPDIRLNVQNRITGATPLHSAIQSSKDPAMNRVECVRLLVANGADVYVKDWYGLNPADAFRADVENGLVEGKGEFAEEMELALDSAADQILNIIPLVEAMDFNGLIDKLGSSRNENDIIEIDERDQNNGMTALYVATQKLGNLVMSSEVENIDMNQLETLSKVILTLLQHDADPNVIPDKNVADTALRDNLSPLYIVCDALSTLHSSTKIRRHLKSIALSLVKSGAILSSSIQHMMHDSARRGHLSNVIFWVEKLAIDPNSKGRQGLTPMHFASRSGRVEIVEWLLSIDGKQKVDCRIIDGRGKTALDAARSNNNEDIIKLITQREEGIYIPKVF